MDDQNADLMAFMAIIQSYQQNPGASLGAWLIAVMICVWFSGVLFIQALTYYSTFTRDSRWLKTLVSVIILCSAAHVSTMILVIWKMLIYNYGNWIGATTILASWLVTIQGFISNVEVLAAQLFYTWRCYVLMGRKKIVAVLLLAGSTTWFVLLTYGCVITLGFRLDKDGAEALSRLAVPGFFIELVTDIVCAGMSTWALIKTRSSFSNRQTESLVRRLTLLIWEAAIPPAFVMSVDIAAWLLTGKRNLIFVIFHALVPEVYGFSLMYTLNSRIRTRRWADEEPRGTDPEKGLQIEEREIRTSRAPVETGTAIKFAIASQGYSDSEIQSTDKNENQGSSSEFK